MSDIGESVLRFYTQLPFNCRETVHDEVQDILRLDLAEICPSILPVIRSGISVLEVGCGVGWLSCHLADRYGCQVTALDFNAVAIERARTTAATMGLGIEFVVGDLFTYEPARRAEIVISLGVLHHTHDCLLGLRRCLDTFARDNADVVVGLYHKDGRRPFRAHFERLMNDGASEEVLLNEYRHLCRHVSDRALLYSWFRDQVLHPHETHHTLREVAEEAAKSGFSVVASSINRFRPIERTEDLYSEEQSYELLARRRLQDGVYFPGFFVTHLRRKARGAD
jgi:cyclopropane fatty-acyl-phospholipid synthase-like methyltransferase